MKRIDRPSSWTSDLMKKLKRIINNRKCVSQTRIFKQFSITQQYQSPFIINEYK